MIITAARSPTPTVGWSKTFANPRKLPSGSRLRMRSRLLTWRPFPSARPSAGASRELWNYERYSAPRKVGGRYFFSKNDGLQNQDVLYVLEALEGTPRVLLDPNQWSKDGTVALAGLSVSEDGKYVAYSIAEAGSDWQTWHVLDVASGKVLPDEIRWTKYRGTSWTHDGKGFFYGRYDEPKPGAKFQNTTLNQKIYYHRVGTPQAEDVLVYRRPDHPEWGCEARVTEDGRYLVITTSKGTAHKHRIAYKDLEEPYGMPIDLIEDFDNQYTFVGNDGPVFYFKTDLAAPRGRLIAIDLRRPERKPGRRSFPRLGRALAASAWSATCSSPAT